MKKMILILAAALLALTLTSSGLAENETLQVFSNATESEAQENVVTGILESIDVDAGEMMLSGTHLGDVLVHFEESVLEETPALVAGVQVNVTTTGAATMSLPAQVNALDIQVHAMVGTVTGFEDGMLIFETQEMGVVAAHLSGGPRVYGLEYAQPGMQVTAFFDGATTRSIPAQMTPDVLVFYAAPEAQ